MNFLRLRALLYLRRSTGYIFFNITTRRRCTTGFAKSSTLQRFAAAMRPARRGVSAGRLNDGMRTIVRMVLHTGTGRGLREADFLEMHEEYRRAGRPLPGGAGVEHPGRWVY